MIRTKPDPHQVEVVKFAYPLDFCGIFAGYGVGKTLIALWITQVKKFKLIVVVTTKTAIDSTWTDEIKKHSNFRYAVLFGSRREKIQTLRRALYHCHGGGTPHSSRPTLVLLVNLEGVRNIFNALIAARPEAIFLDESTEIKNHDALKTKVLWALSKYIPRRYEMTGWPTTEHLSEIYSQIKWLDHGATFGNSFDAFLDKYFKKKNGKWIPKRGAEKKIFDAIKHFCIVIPETVIKLPPKVYRKVGLNATLQQQAVLDQLEQEFKQKVHEGKWSKNLVYALWRKYMDVCDGFIEENGRYRFIPTGKDQALVDILDEIGRDKKVLIWVTRIPVLIKLSRVLRRLGYGVLTLHGNTEDVNAVKKAFQTSPNYNILILTLKKGKASTTYTASHHAIYYSRSWSNDERGNSEARIRRKGSEKWGSIYYFDLFVKNTIEVHAIECVEGKKDMVAHLKKVFGGNDDRKRVKRVA